jgi:hypothetical protein
LKARDVFAAMAGRSGVRRKMTFMSGSAALFCAAVLAALLGTGAPSAGAVEACPNEAIRQAQHSTQLYDCRAWEMVSPVDKNGGEVLAEGDNMVAAADGNGLAFASHAVFGDAVGSGNAGITAYLAGRSPDGWATHAITPTSQPLTEQIFFGATDTQLFSEDLSHALARGYDLPGATDDAPNRINLYLEDTATRDLRTISPGQLDGSPIEYPLFEFNQQTSIMHGASSDLRHVGWVTTAQLSPQAAPGERNVYTWDDGTIHLAGILPDGSVPPEGSWVEPGGYRGAMSADGSRQTFLAAPTPGLPQLYLRIDSSRTVWISEPEIEASTEEPEGIAFQGMTPDGRNVFFVSDTPLLAEDTASGPDLYRWTDSPDPAHDSNLTLITHDGGALNDPLGAGGSLVGMSDDGDRVYVHENNAAMELWSHGVTKNIDAVGQTATPKEHLTLVASEPGFGRVTPDGNWLAYINLGRQMFLYNAEAETLQCASCPAAGGPPASVEVVPQMSEGAGFDYLAVRPRFLSDNGRVFFSTKAALLPEDANGTWDAYEFDGNTGALHLLSSGRGEGGSMFADASLSGDNVFIATRQRLAARDTDGALDFYDVRAGGGFAEPEPSPSPCGGEACQGGPAAGGPAAGIGSSAAQGPGNVKHRRCGARKRKVKRGGKVRCVTKYRKHHSKHKRADRNRRASR